LRRFGEIVTDVWEQKQLQAATQYEAARRHLRVLKERKQFLVEAFVYHRAIDPTITESNSTR
jgi:hypothetical protein